MDRAAFEALRNLPGKLIEADIRFSVVRDARPHLFLDQVEVKNTGAHQVTLEGWYNPNIGSLGLTFTVHGAGPVCRVELNGKVHGNAGRTHKHDLQEPDDPRRNLPHADARPDLAGKSPREVWEILCRQANINHTGRFIDP